MRQQHIGEERQPKRAAPYHVARLWSSEKFAVLSKQTPSQKQPSSEREKPEDLELVSMEEGRRVEQQEELVIYEQQPQAPPPPPPLSLIHI